MTGGGGSAGVACGTWPGGLPGIVGVPMRDPGGGECMWAPGSVQWYMLCEMSGAMCTRLVMDVIQLHCRGCHPAPGGAAGVRVPG